jgi:hypothetical protein
LVAQYPDLFHPLPDLSSTATGTTRQVTAYRDRDRATWYLLDPAEHICIYCALPRALNSHAPCVSATVTHVFEPRGLATARHALAMAAVVETHQVEQRQLRQVCLDGTIHDYWEPLLC